MHIYRSNLPALTHSRSLIIHAVEYVVVESVSLCFILVNLGTTPSPLLQFTADIRFSLVTYSDDRTPESSSVENESLTHIAHIPVMAVYLIRCQLFV